MNERNGPAGDRAAHEIAGRALSLSTVDPSPDRVAEGAPFQLLPPLAEHEYAALKADIRERGIVVPVVVDQHGRILDGHHRRRSAAELGIDCPTTTRIVTCDDDAADLAVTLNAARRHLSREQRRDLIGAEIRRRPEDSDRAIARRVGCDHKTVGSVRREQRGEVPHAPFTPASARALTGEIAAKLTVMRDCLVWLSIDAMSNKIPATEIADAVKVGRNSFGRDLAEDIAAPVREAMFGPLLDWLADPTTAEEWRPQWDHPTFKPLSADEKADALAVLAGAS